LSFHKLLTIILIFIPLLKRENFKKNGDLKEKGSPFNNSGASRKNNTLTDLFSTLKGEIRMCYFSSSSLMVNRRNKGNIFSS
jgi:hypothetical protein